MFIVVTYSLLATLGLVLSLKRNFDLLDRLEAVDDAIQDALEVLDVQHQKIESKTKIEVFSDEPIIRELVQDMATAKESIERISKLLDSSLSQTEEEDEETEEKRET